MTQALRQLDSHFAFGENWKAFVETLSEESIAEAVRSLARLLPTEELRGRNFLDIGCGSGLSMLAALRLGARSVTGIDIDPNSAEAARMLLSRHAAPDVWRVDVASVFDYAPGPGATYDVVHSWGVLHHTGDMWPAVRKAAALVAPHGHLALALYRKTPLCGFWRIEKKIYSRSPKPVQAAIAAVYRGVYKLALMATGRRPAHYISGYKSARGMSWTHDVHDWLGGYPYESVTPQEVNTALAEIGFDQVRAFERPAAIHGLFGSHCDEFVAVRRT
ncbi:MAG: class SAM-dependent methyltransferase [Hyphomicrobiales bacterium]|nr:class SAM-dependent methyltransferase [Hyphomicrobiales bacterium]